MQFTKDAWDGLADGSITVTFRTWERARVREGADYHVPRGVIRVESVTRMRVGDIRPRDAAAAGAVDLPTLWERLGVTDEDLVWRVEFRFVGPDPRIALRETIPDEDELAEIEAKLVRFDETSTHGPWTRSVLALIEQHPGERAADLAAGRGLETRRFKVDVRKLKALGLTESLERGYRLSPRGAAVLAYLRSVT